MERPDQTWFSERLRQFLEERHPSQPRYRRMIERRSRLAFEGYSQSLEAGVPVDQAIRVADRILFRGLLFSPYDTVHLILETDYPAIPQSQRQAVALKLTRICSPIFERTPLGDDYAQRPEFRLLKERLRRPSAGGSMKTECRATRVPNARHLSRNTSNNHLSITFSNHYNHEKPNFCDGGSRRCAACFVQQGNRDD